MALVHNGADFDAVRVSIESGKIAAIDSLS
jgi:hypothetical protein